MTVDVYNNVVSLIQRLSGLQNKIWLLLSAEMSVKLLNFQVLLFSASSAGTRVLSPNKVYHFAAAFDTFLLFVGCIKGEKHYIKNFLMKASETVGHQCSSKRMLYNYTYV